MKILRKTDQEEVLKRIAACQIICNTYIDDVKAYDKITENLADIAIYVGGCTGASKVQNTVKEYYEEFLIAGAKSENNRKGLKKE